MGCRVRNVLEKGLVFSILGMLSDLPRRLVGDGIGDEVVVAFGRDALVVAGQGAWLVEVRGPRDDAVEVVEPSLTGPVVPGTLHKPSHVPLAGHERGVATGLQGLGNRDRSGTQIAQVPIQPVRAHHVADVRLMGVQAGQKGPARRTTARGVVELAVAETASRQTVQVGGVHFPPVTPEIRETHVIVENQNDVGFVGHDNRIPRWQLVLRVYLPMRLLPVSNTSDTVSSTL